MTDRKNFSDVFGGNNRLGVPELTLKRVDAKTADRHGCRSMETPVAIYWGRDIVALVDLVDLYDEEGNRFYND